MTDWNRLGVATLLGFPLLGLWLAACARVDDSTKDAGGSAQPAGSGAAAGGGTGAGGEPTTNLVLQGYGGDPEVYPPPFDARTCLVPVTSSGGGIRCVTRAELGDSNWPHVTLDGGVAALGPADAWRCPQPNEITFSEGCEERGPCCDQVLCGPLTQSSSTATSGARDAGAAGDGGADESEQTCCYYLIEVCLL